MRPSWLLSNGRWCSSLDRRNASIVEEMVGWSWWRLLSFRYDKKIETNPAATTSFRKKSALYSKPRMWFAGSSNREASSTTLDYEVENK